MSKKMYFRGSRILSRAVALALATSAAGTAGIALAADDAPAGRAAGGIEVVVVTGSYIAGTPEDAALPVDVLSADDLETHGSPTVVQLVKTITASQSAIGESNRYIGGGGTASIY